MARFITTVLILLSCNFFLLGCAEKEEAHGGGGIKPPVESEESDLLDFSGKAEPVNCGKNLVKRFIVVPNSNWGRTDKASSSFVTYPDVCAWLGAFWFLEEMIENADLKEDAKARQEALDLLQQVIDRYDNVITGKTTYGDPPKPLITNLMWRQESNRVDYYIFGAISLHIASIMDDPSYEGIEWRQTKEQYLDFGLEYADNQFDFLTRDEFNARFNSRLYNTGNSLFTISEQDYAKWKEYADEGYSWQTRLWIDDMFMITALQQQAYFATGDRKYLDRAVHEMELYINEIQGEDGLYWHSPDAPFFWARGNGWMAVGMPLMLRIIENEPEYASEAALLRNEYESMMASLLKYQQPTGCWAQLIDNPGMWTETSGSAMFAFSFITGVHNGWLDKEKYGAAAAKAWNALMFYLNNDYDLREVCVGTGTGTTLKYYQERGRTTGDTHGQAGMLWCTYALTELANDAIKAGQVQ